MAAAKRTGALPRPVSPDLRHTLARNLRAARRAIGLTQTQLGELANVHREYIGRIERGSASVSIDVLAALARHVQKTPIELLSLTSQVVQPVCKEIRRL
jgi:transcriptional regulator with XRE-family HTH domain